MMVRTRSASMAKGKAKLCLPPTRASPRLATLWSNTAVQIPIPTPDIPVKEPVTSTLPPKKRQNFRMAGESSSRRDTRTPCRRSRRLAALYNVTKPVSKEKVIIEISDDSLQKEDTDLEQNEAVLVAEVGGGVDLPKNDVYDALWAMLDAESETEEIPGEWDMDIVLQNWVEMSQTWTLLDPTKDHLEQKSRRDDVISLSPCTEDRAIFKCGKGVDINGKRHGNKKGSSFQLFDLYSI
ncbi:hypothetical protein PIB30_042399 [Stylosanthes scabra]|uniref:Uncharacterized protein n=1 Tax=Stylosanthes scabra TaxID=79078 RepID=A0ABU6XE19_9FABA|nr:hypothetical protein [Stylosanthes scabra]